MKKNITLIWATLLISFGCASSKKELSKEGQKVEILLRKSKSCQVLGRYKGRNTKGSVELAQNEARNKAGADGANNIFFDEEFSNGNVWTVWAIAYKC